MTYEIPPELAAAANRLWPQMVRAEEPLPAWAAVDNLQDDWDDRDLCIRVLVVAAVDHVSTYTCTSLTGFYWPVAYSMALGALERDVRNVRCGIDLGSYHLVHTHLDDMSRCVEEVRVINRNLGATWAAWVTEARKILAICVDMEAHRNRVL